MVDWTMFIPWRKLQPLAIMLVTVSAVYLLLQVFGLEIVAKNDSAATKYSRMRADSRDSSNKNSRRPLDSRDCPIQNDSSNWCSEIKLFTAESPDVISTFDLPNITDYSVDGTGRYVFPDTFYEPANVHENVGTIDVILVPFSHVDPGYGQTMEDYYKIYVRSKFEHDDLFSLFIGIPSSSRLCVF